MRKTLTLLSLCLTAALALALSACGPINDTNKHLENMDANTRAIDTHMQGIDSRMTEITGAVNSLTAQLAQMQMALQEVMIAALRVMFPPAGTGGSEFDLPTADEMGNTGAHTTTTTTALTTTGAATP